MSEGAAVLRPAALCAAVAQLSHTGLDSPPAVASTQSAVWFRTHSLLDRSQPHDALPPSRCMPHFDDLSGEHSGQAMHAAAWSAWAFCGGLIGHCGGTRSCSEGGGRL